jgi:transcriptional regulator with XRE-family HTH domain
MEKDVDFGSLIRTQRQAAGISQKALGQRIITKKKPDGVWATYIGQLEKGDKVPSAEICIAIARALEVDPYFMLALAFRERAETLEERVLSDVLLSLIKEGWDTKDKVQLADGPIASMVEVGAGARRDQILRILDHARDVDDAKWEAICAAVDVAAGHDGKLVTMLMDPKVASRRDQLLHILKCAGELDDSGWTLICNTALAIAERD